MESILEGPRQFKQPSRKGKKAWRKNVDITEVQSGLETVRDEVTTTGGVIAEKPSTELFTIDPTPSTAIQSTYLKSHKPLKSDEILARRSAVPAVDSRKRASSTFSKVTDGVIIKRQRRTGGVSHKELQRLKRIANGETPAHDTLTQTESTAADHDPWAEESSLPPTLTVDPSFSFLPAPQPIRPPPTLQQAPISLSATGAPIPAVKRPAPEKSYNPPSTVYFSAFLAAGEAEVAAEKKRLLRAEADRLQAEKFEAAARNKDQHGMDEDDEAADDESAWEGLDSEVEPADDWLLRSKRPERKTQVQRNKIKRRKEEERRKVHDSKQNKREAQAKEAQQIARAVEARDLARRARADEEGEKAAEEGDDAVLRRRRLGKTFVPEKNLELVLPSELSESLRMLKPEGNLLSDRFRSVLVRGKVETRAPIQQPKRARRMETEKWSYKDWKLKRST